MEISNLLELIGVSSGNVAKRELVDEKDLGVKLLSLAPGQVLPPHATPSTALFYIVSGEGLMQVEEEEQPIRPGSLIKTDPKVRHGIKNTGKESLSILLVQGPNPFFCC